MIKKTKVVYLTGKPGVGKYTIAKVFAKSYGYVICDNQLVNNTIFELLQYNGYAKIPDFAWDSIANIRREILSFLSKKHSNNYVLTNCLAENDEDREIYEQVKMMAELRGSDFYPVRLNISKEEHLKRVTRPERRERWKSIDPKNAEDNGIQLVITHPNFLELDISKLSAEEVAIELIKKM